MLESRALFSYTKRLDAFMIEDVIEGIIELDSRRLAMLQAMQKKVKEKHGFACLVSLRERIVGLL